MTVVQPEVVHGPTRMSPADLKRQADEAREMMRAVLIDGVDFGNIPGIKKPSLFKAGAEWLLRWARMGHQLEQVAIERDDMERPFGVTYRCTVTFLDDPGAIVATCDGYCGYDEPDREAHKNRWNKEVPRSPWNTIIKMAQKRALVGATLQATATSGLFTQDVEDIVSASPPEPTIGKYKVAEITARLDSFGRYPQEWIDAGLPPRPNLDTLPVSRIEEAEQILDAAEERAAAERVRENEAAQAEVRETAATVVLPQHEAAEGVAAAVAAGTAGSGSSEGAAVSRPRGAKR